MKTARENLTKRDRALPKKRRGGFCALLIAVSLLAGILPSGNGVLRAEELPDSTAPSTGDPFDGATADPEQSSDPSTETPATDTPAPSTGSVSRFVFSGSRENRERVTASLDGIWYASVFEGGFFERYHGEPLDFTDEAQVPGLVSGAEGDVCVVYRQTFVLSDINATDHIFLEMRGARFGRRVYINGSFAGAYAYNYSASRFDVTDLVREGENEIVILLGNGERQIGRASDPGHVYLGETPESRLPGITDSVNLIITGSVVVGNVKLAPSLEDGVLTVTAEIKNLSGLPVSDSVQITIYELGIVEDGVNSLYDGVGFVSAAFTAVPGAVSVTDPIRIRLRAFEEKKQWRPDRPYLYEIEIRTGEDTERFRFGMRTFSMNEENGYPMLNENPYFITGTVIDFDALFGTAGTRVWDRTWVYTMLRGIKSCGLTAVKSSMGGFPQFWYDIADELGMSLIAEYPIGKTKDPCKCTASTLFSEIGTIMDSLGTHASVFVWDVKSGEESEEVIRQVIYALRDRDVQKRPWDNGASAPVSARDWIECDVTALRQDFTLEDLGNSDFVMRHWQSALPWNLRDYNNAKIIMEYAASFAVSKEGEPLPGTETLWALWLPDAGNAARLRYYDETVAALTEYWRSSRRYMGIFLPAQVFAASFDAGDVPAFRAEAAALISNAFSPVGITVEYYVQNGGRGDAMHFDVAVMNDTFADLGGLEVTVQLLNGSNVLYSETKQYDSIRKFGTEGRDIVRREFNLTIPATVTDNTEITLVAYFLYGGKRVESMRRILVSGGAMYESPASRWIVMGSVGVCAVLIVSATVVAFGRLRQNDAMIKRRKTQKTKG